MFQTLQKKKDEILKCFYLTGKMAVYNSSTVRCLSEYDYPMITS